jgi:hypothetical protein
MLALVEDMAQPNPWDAAVGPILGRYSMNSDFAPYSMLTVVAELEQRRLFRLRGAHTTVPAPFRQSIDEWVETFHARNGFSRDRMAADAASTCDTALRAAIGRFCPDGLVEQSIAARVIWGVP